MSAAQARFRRLVALYPATWQAAHGEAYLGVMLDVADAAGRSGPTARERFSALRHAASIWRRELAARGAGDPVVGSMRWVGPAGLVVGSVLAMLCLTLGEIPGLFSDAVPGPTWMAVLAPLWLVALGAALAGRRRAARRVLAAVAVLPLPVLLVAVSQLGGATDADGATIRLFPALARLVRSVVAAGWIDVLVTGQPPLLVFAASTACAAVACLVGPARSRRGRSRTAMLVAAGVVVTTAYLVATGGALTSGGAFYQGGLDLLLPPLLALTAIGTGAGVMLVVHRPGALASVALLGWPWAVAAIVTQHGTIAGFHVFPWAVEAFALMLLPGLLGATVAGAVALRRVLRAGRVAA